MCFPLTVEETLPNRKCAFQDRGRISADVHWSVVGEVPPALAFANSRKDIELEGTETTGRPVRGPSVGASALHTRRPRVCVLSVLHAGRYAAALESAPRWAEVLVAPASSVGP